MEFTIEKIPVWAMCYLVNGDFSGMTDEDKDMADEWWERNNVVSVSPASDDEGSSHPYLPIIRLSVSPLTLLTAR